MKFNIFGKKETSVPAKPTRLDPAERASGSKPAEQAVSTSVPTAHSRGAHGALKNFYVSEKATRTQGENQYMFKVSPQVNAQEIAKHVSKLYDVVVTKVHVLNMPHKRRDIGRHPGIKIGFRKAMVTLAPGHRIQQAKP